MSKLTDIKYRIDQLDGGAFQRLCDAYLSYRGYGAGYSLGMKTGTDKTTKGNPDTYFLTTDGKYIFAMYTTQKKSFYQKAIDDIQKCFDAQKTGLLPDDISEIVYCHTYERLSPGEDQCLHNYCKERHATLTLIGLDELGNDLYFKYPRIARDFLGISVDSGQIMSLSDFVKTNDANRMAAPLNTEFLCREEEVASAKKMLKKSRVLVIAGPAGTGKTRLALKVCEDYSKEKGLELLCIKSNGLEIYDDLKTELEPGKNYLVFVDDANELSGLNLVLGFLPMIENDQHCIHTIVVTVRDYAKKQVIERILEVEKPEFLKVEPLKEDVVRKMMTSAYGITNPLYLDRIVDIAEGNARLAMLAGRLSVESQSLESIQNASELYEHYYCKQIDSITDCKTGIVSAGILAFFQSLHLGQLEQLEPIFATANITTEQFIADIKQLHHVELVDICQDLAVKVSDQSFSNYLIKYVFIDKKAILLNRMIESGLLFKKERTIMACNILNSLFYDEDTMKYLEEQINIVWARLENDDKSFATFFKAFHMIRPTETLLLVKKSIEEEPFRHIDVLSEINQNSNGTQNITDDIINVLCDYKLSEQLPEAVDLLLLYYQKRPDLFEQVLTALTSEFGVSNDSPRFNYYIQTTVIERLSAAVGDYPTKNNQILFVKVAEYFLHLVFSKAEGGKRNTITYYTMPLTAENPVFAYRNKIIKQLFAFYKKGDCQKEIESLLLDYCKSEGDESEYEIVEHEMKSILPFFSMLSTDSLRHCIIAENIQEVARLAGYNCKDVLIPFLESKKYSVYDALKFHSEDWDDYNTAEGYNRQKERVKNLVQHFDLTDLCLLIDVCNECIESVDKEARQLSSAVEYVFESICDNTELYVETVKKYLDADTPYDHRPDIILARLFEIMDPESVKKLIESSDYSQKNTWLWFFYSELPERFVSEKWKNDLLCYLQITPKELNKSPYRCLECIKKYERVDRGVLLKASRIINRQFETSPYIFGLYFYYTVNPRDKADTVIRQFEKDFSLLEEIYTKYYSYSSREDRNGELLAKMIEVDSLFLNRYIDIGIEEKRAHFGSNQDWGQRLFFIWADDGYIALMESVANYIYQKLPNKPWAYRLISQLLNEKRGKITQKQNEWIEHTIEQHHQNEQWMYMLFSAISNQSTNRRRTALKHFLELNKEYSAFESLPLESLSWGGMGSLIQYMQERIDFLSSLLPFLSGLDYLQHKQKVINDIEMWEDRIKREEINELLMS